MPKFDFAVVGLGAMGGASAYSLTQRGASVVAFDQLSPPHEDGSTHGQTRIIREAYFEHPLYVPLVRRSYELWAELERDAGETLFTKTGGVMVGTKQGSLFRGALASALQHGVEHEILDAKQLQRRFPAYHPKSEWMAVLEHRAGVLSPERCVQLMLEGARARGAELHLQERVTGWAENAGGVTVSTTAGTYDASCLVVAAGPWMPALCGAMGHQLPLEIERQMSHWFEPEDPDDGRYSAGNCPVGLWEMPDGDVFATLPDFGKGVKCGMHHAGAVTSADTVSRVVSKGENAVARELLEMVMPGAGGRLLGARVCLYTNTPDRHFIIDWLVAGKILILSPCSGHGFKFATAIGEIVADLASGGKTASDITPFSLARFN